MKALEYYFKISRIWLTTGIKREEKKIWIWIIQRVFTDIFSTIGKEKIMKRNIKNI